MTLRSFGPVRFGASYSEACPALGACVTPPEDEAGCWLWSPFGLDYGVAFMVSDGRVVRVDVNGEATRTRSGVRVGAPEAEVTHVYGDRIRVTPHKYTFAEGGHYLTFEPRDAADAQFRVIFETDGARVERYRAGLRPFVEYVEGCS